MQRRDFLRSLVGGVAVAAAAHTWPFRVYSFPTNPLPLSAGEIVGILSFQDEGEPYTWIMNVDQAKAMHEIMPRIKYRVAKVEQGTKIITLEMLPSTEFAPWKNLSRSPKPLRVGVT